MQETVTNISVDFDGKGQRGMDFFTGGSVSMDYGLYDRSLKFKCLNDGFVLHTVTRC